MKTRLRPILMSFSCVRGEERTLQAWDSQWSHWILDWTYGLLAMPPHRCSSRWCQLTKSKSSHLNNFFELCDNSLLIEDPEGNMVRSLHFTLLPRIYQTPLEVFRRAHEMRLSPDAHRAGSDPPCRTRDANSSLLSKAENEGWREPPMLCENDTAGV